tara:strand:- start:266 stop:616 length:351 start_codon:yes stop_codon:yes gene_type:complete
MNQNLIKIEQEILMNYMMNHKTATKDELIDALTVNGADSLTKLPLKNAVRAHMNSLKSKFKGHGITFVTIEINNSATYTLTEEADNFIFDNLAEVVMDEDNIEMVYSLPIKAKKEE